MLAGATKNLSSLPWEVSWGIRAKEPEGEDIPHGSAPKAGAVPYRQGTATLVIPLPVLHPYKPLVGTARRWLGAALRWVPEQAVRVRRRGGKTPKSPGSGERSRSADGVAMATQQRGRGKGRK